MKITKKHSTRDECCFKDNYQFNILSLINFLQPNSVENFVQYNLLVCFKGTEAVNFKSIKE
jgi:hypothetical protein